MMRLVRLALYMGRVGLVGLVVYGGGACGGAAAKQPDKPKVVVYGVNIEVIGPISFVGDEPSPSSHQTLDAVAASINRDLDVKYVEVRVHVADGDEATRQERADRRAQAIVDYMIGKQVAPARLVAVGVTTPVVNPAHPVDFITFRGP